MSPVPIYTHGRRETKWSRIPCLREQRDVRGLKPGPPDPELEVLTALLIYGLPMMISNDINTNLKRTSLIETRSLPWFLWQLGCYFSHSWYPFFSCFPHKEPRNVALDPSLKCLVCKLFDLLFKGMFQLKPPKKDVFLFFCVIFFISARFYLKNKIAT